MGSGTDEYWKMRKKEREMEAVVKKLKDNYFICGDCATKYGAKLEGCHTFSNQECPMCGEQKSCNAITDWHWPKEFGIGYIWD